MPCPSRKPHRGAAQGLRARAEGRLAPWVDGRRVGATRDRLRRHTFKRRVRTWAEHVARSGCASLIVTIQAAGFSDLHGRADLGALHRPRRRAIHGKRAVTAPAVVVREVVAEEPPQMPLVEDDDVVQALAADAADHPLDERVLPGIPRGCRDFFDPHALDALLEFHFSTVALATWMPNLASSPTMRGDPQRGFAPDISRIRSRTTSATAGLPGAAWERRAQ